MDHGWVTFEIAFSPKPFPPVEFVLRKDSSNFILCRLTETISSLCTRFPTVGLWTSDMGDLAFLDM